MFFCEIFFLSHVYSSFFFVVWFVWFGCLFGLVWFVFVQVWGHGTEDPVVLPEQVPVGIEVLKASGLTNITTEMYPNMGHSSCPQETSDLYDFVQACFARK